MRSSYISSYQYPLLGTVVLVMSGQTMAETVAWEALSAEEQAVLKPFEAEWSAFSENKQQSLRRWAAKSPEERMRIKQRYAEWKQLPPSSQAQIAHQLKRYKAMSPTKRAKIKAWHHWVKKLPKAEQKKLREVWSTLDEAERKAYVQALRQQYGG